MATWPSVLPYQPLQNSLVHKLPEPRLRSDSEAGPGRVRRRSTLTVQRVEQTWSWSRAQYETWRAWHRWQVGQGEEWFTLPLFTGAAYADCSARLVGLPKARPQGGTWLVSPVLETYDMPVVELEDLDPVWPEGLPYQPVPESIDPQPHEELLRSDWEEGPIAVRRRFVNTPGRQDQAWDLSLPEYETFRAWYRLALLDGVRWFDLQLWTGDRYRASRCRFREPPEARLRGDVWWRVTASLEVKLLDTLSAGELSAVLSGPSLHHLIHITMPAALPAGS